MNKHKRIPLGSDINKDTRKQISFDLDTGILKEIHGEKNYTKAYSDIRSFMESNDFEHIEGSVYASKNTMNNQKVMDLIEDLKEKHEYLDKCVKGMHQTDIGDTHSLTWQFNYDGTPGKFAQKSQEKPSPTGPESETEAQENKFDAENLNRRFTSTLTTNMGNCQTSKDDSYGLL